MAHLLPYVGRSRCSPSGLTRQHKSNKTQHSEYLTNLIVSRNSHWAALCCPKSETGTFKLQRDGSYVPGTLTTTLAWACGASRVLNDPPVMTTLEPEGNIKEHLIHTTNENALIHVKRNDRLPWNNLGGLTRVQAMTDLACLIKTEAITLSFQFWVGLTELSEFQKSRKMDVVVRSGLGIKIWSSI